METATNERMISVPVNEYQAFKAWYSSVASEEFKVLESSRHKKGLVEIARGNYVTLAQLKNDLANSYRQSSQKKSGKITKR
ncbi:MAG: hypothetical protein AAB453_03970 [Patescibacteria group bacterium]